MEIYDAAICGLGMAGSAAAWQLSSRGAKVAGFDMYRPPHSHGSSHGSSRIIRTAYFEDPHYVPLLQRAWQLWQQLEGLAGEKLLIPCGGLMVGAPDAVLVPGCLASAREHRLAYQLLSSEEMQAAYPQFRFEDWMRGVAEPQAGILRPEACVAAQLAAAAGAGAELNFDVRVHGWRSIAGGIEVQTGGGSLMARQLILCAGPWLPQLATELQPALRVERQVQFFIESHDPAFDPAVCPVSIWEYEAQRFFYAIPLLDGSVKVCFHERGEQCSPDSIRREVEAAEFERLAVLIKRYMPALAGRPWRAATCMYTTTADGHFIVDRHPQEPRVLIISACSGHGFKFAPVLGELAADLLLEGESAHESGLFALSRPGI